MGEERPSGQQKPQAETRPGRRRRPEADAPLAPAAALLNLGNDTMDMSPAEFSKFVRSEIEVYGRLLKAAGIKPQ